MRSLKRRVDSSGSRRSGLPNVTRVRPGLGTAVPLPMIESVPSMYTGTTGAPVRPARYDGAAPERLPPAVRRASAFRVDDEAPAVFDQSRHQVGRLASGDLAVHGDGVEGQRSQRRLPPLVEEVVGGRCGHEVCPPRRWHAAHHQRRVEMAVVVGGEDHRRRVGVALGAAGEIGEAVVAADLGVGDPVDEQPLRPGDDQPPGGPWRPATAPTRCRSRRRATVVRSGTEMPRGTVGAR